MNNEDLFIWPDGTQCRRDELSDMNFMSDDYIVVPFESEWYPHDGKELNYDLLARL